MAANFAPFKTLYFRSLNDSTKKNGRIRKYNLSFIRNVNQRNSESLAKDV